jgi:hypothetical protein
MKPSSTSRKAPFRSMSRARRPSATDSPLHTLVGLEREVVHAPATVEVHEKRMTSGV